MKTYISTIAFLGQPVERIFEMAKEQEFNLEFSSALPFHPDMEKLFNDYPFPKLAHNYFPAPQDPFVLNLASKDENIRQRSIAHCKNGLKMSKKANAPFFAAHAGFCLDPKPEELGKKLQQSTELINKEAHWILFIESVEEIMKLARELNVDFYIENNVTAQMNINTHGQNPLFCAEPHEMIRLFNHINDPHFGILLDTAHLKVSSRTMKFSLDLAVDQLQSTIKAIHHSDNEGLLDNNQPLEADYWFLQFVSRFSNIPHVIEVKKQDIADLKRQMDLLENPTFSIT